MDTSAGFKFSQKRTCSGLLATYDVLRRLQRLSSYGQFQMRIQETRTHKRTWLCWPSKIANIVYCKFTGRGTVKIEPEQREDIKHLVNWKETLHLYDNLAYSKEFSEGKFMLVKDQKMLTLINSPSSFWSFIAAVLKIMCFTSWHDVPWPPLWGQPKSLQCFWREPRLLQNLNLKLLLGLKDVEIFSTNTIYTSILQEHGVKEGNNQEIEVW